MANNTCRICLATNIRMHNIRDTTYSLVYEKNTGCKLTIGNQGPDTICLYCNMLLLKFTRFLNMSRKAEKFHSLHSQQETVIDLTDDSCGVIIDLEEAFHNLGSTDTQCISVNSETNFNKDVFNMRPVIKRRPVDFIEDVAVKIERVDCNEFEMFQEMPISFDIHSEDDDDGDDIDDDQPSRDKSGAGFYNESDHDHTYSQRADSTFDKSYTLMNEDRQEPSTDLVNEGNVVTINKGNVVSNINGKNVADVNGENVNNINEKNVNNINKENVVTNVNGEYVVTNINKDSVVTEINPENVNIKNKKNVVTIIYEESVSPIPNMDETVANLLNKENIKTHTVFAMKTRRRHYSEAKPANRKIHAVNRKKKPTRSVNAENVDVNVIEPNKIRSSLELPKDITPAKPKRGQLPATQTNSKHSHATRLNTKKPQYSCHDCNFSSDIKRNLHSHIRSTHDIRPHSCKACSQRFPTLKLLAKHVKSIHGTLDCSLCGKELTTAFSYRRHMRLHSQTKLYHCETCYRGFKHRSMYLVHARTHTGEKPFRCKWCDRAFNDKSNCRKHMLSHEGRRQKYTCALCQKNFWQKSQLKSHAIEHIV